MSSNKPVQTMKVITALEAELESRFGIEAIIEPSNARARLEIRVVPSGITSIKRLSADNMFQPVAYEVLMKVGITLRISGGNTNGYLATQATLLTIDMHEYLVHDLIVLKDIGEPLKIPGKRMASLDHRLDLVGDAELIDAKREQAGWTGTKEQDDYGHTEELFVFREDWSATLVMTAHRHYFNPRLKQITAINDITHTETVITHDNDN